MGETRRLRFCGLALLLAVGVYAQDAGRSNVPYSDAKPILDTLRAELLPADLQALTPVQREAAWTDWVSRRDTQIRARLAAGDEDSVITLLLFGVTFTTQPRYSFGGETAARTPDSVAADPIIQRRITDLVNGLAAPGANERLQFARHVIERRGIDVTTAAGRQQATQALRSGLTRTLSDYNAYVRDAAQGATQFRNRGLSSDTSIYAAYAVDSALKDLAATGALAPGSVRRVAVVGPGLDFTDKQEGYDFYPLQTIQPFAVIDSLRARTLAGEGLRMTTFDVNPRVSEHIQSATQRAAGGTDYTIQLPHDRTQRWHPDLVTYWMRVGSMVGTAVKPITPPPGAGRVDMRAVRVRPDVVTGITPRDLDIILQRPASLPESERFDLVIATNILIYYDVFEQSLALTNIARMLHPGGVLLTNNPLFELPAIPMRQIGETKVSYTDTGSDWIAWYQRE